MTLLATEILKHDKPDAVIVFQADRRITRGRVRDSEQPKIFQIPRLSAGIGYFGLAEVPTPGVRSLWQSGLNGFSRQTSLRVWRAWRK